MNRLPQTIDEKTQQLRQAFAAAKKSEREAIEATRDALSRGASIIDLRNSFRKANHPAGWDIYEAILLAASSSNN